MCIYSTDAWSTTRLNLRALNASGEIAVLRSVTGKSLSVGLIGGVFFGLADLFLTWLRPLEDDSPSVLLRLYGPMFLLWMAISFAAARHTGRIRAGAIAGVAVAFGTFCIFVVINFLRVNVFLDQLTGRPDWQNMMGRFRASGSDNLRLFINLDYLRGTPLKVGFFTALGGIMGTIAGSVGRLSRRRHLPTAS